MNSFESSRAESRAPSWGQSTLRTWSSPPTISQSGKQAARGVGGQVRSSGAGRTTRSLSPLPFSSVLFYFHATTPATRCSSQPTCVFSDAVWFRKSGAALEETCQKTGKSCSSSWWTFCACFSVSGRILFPHFVWQWPGPVPLRAVSCKTWGKGEKVRFLLGLCDAQDCSTDSYDLS